jgi:uncharacterized protein with PIN domain
VTRDESNPDFIGTDGRFPAALVGVNNNGGYSRLKFLADTMLGRLAKWLRVLGYDTHYERYYPGGAIRDLLGEERRLLSRNRHLLACYPETLLIHANRVGDQLREVVTQTEMNPDRSTWFRRCLVCNELLEAADAEEARERIPEYVYYQGLSKIRACPSCGRCFWPGSHRERMIKQLSEWGFT